MDISKKSFFILSFSLVFAITLEIVFIEKIDQKVIANFLQTSTLTGFSFHVNSLYLRHRDLNNVDILFDFSAGLKERDIATFLLKAPLK